MRGPRPGSGQFYVKEKHFLQEVSGKSQQVLLGEEWWGESILGQVHKAQTHGSAFWVWVEEWGGCVRDAPGEMSRTIPLCYGGRAVP